MAKICYYPSYVEIKAKIEEKSKRNRIIRFLKRILPKRLSSFLKEDTRWRQGLKGQLEVQRYLNNLSDEYEVRHDLSVHNSDIDHAVIGPNGIFVIQTKNLSGKIILKNGQFYRTRKDIPDNPIKNNPIEQVLGDVVKLSEYLENRMYNKGVKVKLPEKLEPILVFASATKLEIDDKYPRIKILRPNDLCEYIMNFKGPEKISKKRLDKIKKLFPKENIVEYKI